MIAPCCCSRSLLPHVLLRSRRRSCATAAASRWRRSVRSAAQQASRAGVPFEGVARELIVALKFRHADSAAGVLAAQMVRRLRLDHVDVVTWAPTSARRVRRRGYDQAEVIARAVARQLGVPCRRLLYRAHGAPADRQVTRRRLVGPAFRARRPRQGSRCWSSTTSSPPARHCAPPRRRCGGQAWPASSWRPPPAPSCGTRPRPGCTPTDCPACQACRAKVDAGTAGRL